MGKRESGEMRDRVWGRKLPHAQAGWRCLDQAWAEDKRRVRGVWTRLGQRISAEVRVQCPYGCSSDLRGTSTEGHNRCFTETFPILLTWVSHENPGDS